MAAHVTARIDLMQQALMHRPLPCYLMFQVWVLARFIRGGPCGYSIWAEVWHHQLGFAAGACGPLV